MLKYRMVFNNRDMRNGWVKSVLCSKQGNPVSLLSIAGSILLFLRFSPVED